MATSDYLLLLDWLAGDSAGLQVPAKLYEYVRIGRPILACTTRNSAASRVLGLSGIPHEVLTPEDSQEQLEQKLLRFLSLSTEPRKITDGFAAAFAADKQAEHLSQLIQNLVCGHADTRFSVR
jgi:hypothetical protein